MNQFELIQSKDGKGGIEIQVDGQSIKLERSSAELLACLILSNQSTIEPGLFYSVWRHFSAALNTTSEKSAQSPRPKVVSLPKSQIGSSPLVSRKHRPKRSQGRKAAKGHS